MTLFQPTTSALLRTAIQSALAADIVQLTGAGPFTSITTLTKIARGAVRADQVFGYTVQGSNVDLSQSQTLQNTRIFQQNIDGPYAPGTIKNLTLSYTAIGAANGNALLSVENAGSTRNFIIDNVSFTGFHSGWNGNGNKYMSLIGGDQVTIDAAIELKNSAVSITGQNNGFQATKGVGSGGSAFFHNWNNLAAIKIQNTNFDEAGFLSSFNLLNITSGINGSALIDGNTFRRTADQNVRWEGNRLQNVDATLKGNTFSDGSYLDLYGEVGSIKINGSTTVNTFNTISDGYGIRMTDALTGTPTITGSNVFAGGGLALKFVKATAGSTSLTTSGTFTVNSFTCANLFAGGQASDTIAGNATANNWISGDTGNDNLTGGTGDDSFVFATALNASTNVDTITNFTNSSGQADKICLANSVFTGLSPGSLNAGDFDIVAGSGIDVVFSGGDLYFAAGGSGTLAGYTKFATLSGSLTLSNADFRVF
jgi:Ca2+-binding RTX toxin-like protein